MHVYVSAQRPWPGAASATGEGLMVEGSLRPACRRRIRSSLAYTAASVQWHEKDLVPALTAQHVSATCFSCKSEPGSGCPTHHQKRWCSYATCSAPPPRSLHSFNKKLPCETEKLLPDLEPAVSMDQQVKRYHKSTITMLKVVHYFFLRLFAVFCARFATFCARFARPLWHKLWLVSQN